MTGRGNLDLTERLQEFYAADDLMGITNALAQIEHVIRAAGSEVSKSLSPLGIGFELRITPEAAAYATSSGNIIILHMPKAMIQALALPEAERKAVMKQITNMDVDITPANLLSTLIHEAGHNLMFHVANPKIAQTIKEKASEILRSSGSRGAAKVMAGHSEAQISSTLVKRASASEALDLIKIMTYRPGGAMDELRYALGEEMTSWSTSAFMCYTGAILKKFAEMLSQYASVYKWNTRRLVNNIGLITIGQLERGSPFQAIRNTAVALVREFAPSANMTGLYTYFQRIISGGRDSIVDAISIGAVLSFVADQYDKKKGLDGIDLGGFAKYVEGLSEKIEDEIRNNGRYAYTWGQQARAALIDIMIAEYLLALVVDRLPNRNVGEAMRNVLLSHLALSEFYFGVNLSDVYAKAVRDDDEVAREPVSHAIRACLQNAGGLYPKDVSTASRYVAHNTIFTSLDPKNLGNKRGIDETRLVWIYGAMQVKEVNNIFKVVKSLLAKHDGAFKQKKKEIYKRVGEMMGGAVIPPALVEKGGNIGKMLDRLVRSVRTDGDWESLFSVVCAAYILVFGFISGGQAPPDNPRKPDKVVRGDGEGGTPTDPFDDDSDDDEDKEDKKDKDDEKKDGDDKKKDDGEDGEKEREGDFEVPESIVENLSGGMSNPTGGGGPLRVMNREMKAKAAMIQLVVGAALERMAFKVKKFMSDMQHDVGAGVIMDKAKKVKVVPTVKSPLGQMLNDLAVQAGKLGEEGDVVLPRVGTKKQVVLKKFPAVKVMGAMGDTSGSMHGYHGVYYDEDMLREAAVKYILSGLAGMAVGHAYNLASVLNATPGAGVLGFSASVAGQREHVLLLPDNGIGIGQSGTDELSFRVFKRYLGGDNISSYEYGLEYAADLMIYARNRLATDPRAMANKAIVIGHASYFTGDFHFVASHSSYIRGVFDGLLYPSRMHKKYHPSKVIGGGVKSVEPVEVYRWGNAIVHVFPEGVAVLDYVGALFIEIGGRGFTDWGKLQADYADLAAQQEIEGLQEFDGGSLQLKTMHPRAVYQMLPKSITYVNADERFAEMLWAKALQAVQDTYGEAWKEVVIDELRGHAKQVSNIIGRVVSELSEQALGIKTAFLNMEAGRAELGGSREATLNLQLPPPPPYSLTLDIL